MLIISLTALNRPSVISLILFSTSLITSSSLSLLTPRLDGGKIISPCAQQQKYFTKMSKTENDNCGADDVDNYSVHSIYDDVLSHIIIPDDELPSEKNNWEAMIDRNDTTTLRYDSDEAENNSLQSTYDDIVMFQPKIKKPTSANYEMSNSRRWESFQTGIDSYDSADLLSLDDVNDASICSIRDDIFHHQTVTPKSQRKMIKSRNWESFRTGKASYGSSDVLSLDDSYDDDLSFESKVDLDGSRSTFSVRRTMYEEYYGTEREINNLSSRIQTPQHINFTHTDERIVPLNDDNNNEGNNTIHDNKNDIYLRQPDYCSNSCVYVY